MLCTDFGLTVFYSFPDVVDSQFIEQVDNLPDIVDSIPKYKDADEKLSALLRQTSWTNNLTIMSRSKSADERLFYLHLCIHDRLSTRQLDRQIDSALYERVTEVLK